MVGRSTMLDAALSYAARGWPVLPLCWPDARGGCPCGGNHRGRDVGKAPVPWLTPHGLKDATTSEAQIREWWSKAPLANIGLRTGPDAGFWVLDVDAHKGGMETLRRLEGEHGALPDTPTSLTGGGGEHRLFAFPPGVDLRNSAERLGPGLDVRATGGYIVAPPSLHVSGRRYEWDALAHPDNLPLATPPAWLVLEATAPNPDRNGNGHARGLDTATVLRGVPEGQRDEALFRLAAKLRGADVPRDVAERLVLETAASCMPPFPSDLALKKVASAYDRYPPGRSTPAAEPSRGNTGASSGAPSAGEPSPDPKPGNAPAPGTALTDLGNAERFIQLHGEDVRYVPAWQKWLVWDGVRWLPDDLHSVEQLAHATARSIRTEADNAMDEKHAEKILKHAAASENDGKIRAMLNRARALPGVAITPDQLDTNGWLLNCPNGTLDLRTGDLRPHRREDFITKLCPVAYDQRATAPTWEQFLQRVMDGNERLLTFLQRMAGYCLTGDTSERCLFILHGSGRNGKSTFVETLTAMLGEDYARRSPTDMLLSKRDTSPIPNDIARLKGVRFTYASEAGEGQRLNEERIKELTGGSDTITARFMKGEWFDFRPEFKLVFSTNHKPVIRGTDQAIWDRLRLVPFSVRIPDAEIDPNLAEKLRAELPGILNWALEGCIQRQIHGLGTPEEVQEATADYREEMDVLSAFLTDCCIIRDDVRATNRALYERYDQWCKSNGAHALSSEWFGRKLGEHGFKRIKSNGKVLWAGIALVAEEAWQ